MSVDQAYNYKNVDESLSTSGLLSEEQLGMLSQEGYDVVINLLPEDSEYAIAKEQCIVKGQGLEYVYIPVDFSEPTTENYQKFATAIKEHSNKKVMVHCAANYRVSAFYAIYASQYLGWSASQAEDFIASIWNLNEYPQWEDFVTTKLQGANS